MMNTEIVNYLELMKDSLLKKEKALASILELTGRQENLLDEAEFAAEAFDGLISKKSLLIEEINKLDEGFALIYKRIADKLKANPAIYRERVEKLQKLIRLLVDRGLEIETAERKNQIKFDMKVSESRRKIKSYNLNSSAVTKYYSNMSGSVGEGTYFIDHKK